MSIHPIKTILTNHSWQEPEKTTPMQPRHLQKRSYSQLQEPSTTKRVRLTANHISWLWLEMIELYGQPFVNRNGLHDKGLWLDVLCELTPKALESGLERLKDLTAQGKFLDFAPNCLQFKAICMAYYEDLRLPKAHDALREIRNFRNSPNHPWSHPLVEFIFNRLPNEFYDLIDEHKTDVSFGAVYEEVTDLIKQGHELPQSIRKKRIKRPSNPDIARVHLHQIKQHIGA